ncbi:hypothetical protein JCM16106_11310 [Hydrogenophilus islandicus]
MAWRTGRHCRGFTLAELVAVIVILSVLTFVALPRLTDMEDYCAAEYRDTLLAALRFARNGAVAHRRPVCVTLTGGGVAVMMAHNAGGEACSGAARSPFYPPDLAAGDSALQGSILVAPARCRAQVTVAASDTPFLFCPRGDLRVSGAASACSSSLSGAGSGPGGVVTVTVTHTGGSSLPAISVSPAGGIWVEG